MKQIALLLTLFIALNTYGQLTKRTWLLGGSGSLYSYHDDYVYPLQSYTAQYTNIDIAASVGYFFVDKLACGIRPYLSTYKGESSGGGGANDLKLAIGPFLRYYFLNKDKQFNLLADISYQLGINQARNGDNPKGKFNIFSVMAGAEVFFNSSVGLEVLLGYKSQLTTFDNSPSAFSNNRKGFLTSIGFHFHLEKN
ncbi:MAG TPA: hypothetical protein VFD03_04630 [Clostridia bacterium]|nr:hypothetical protein [Clostridia bacterium]